MCIICKYVHKTDLETLHDDKLDQEMINQNQERLNSELRIAVMDRQN